jgi:orotidine-5'-phosphate decarboxylase
MAGSGISSGDHTGIRKKKLNIYLCAMNKSALVAQIRQKQSYLCVGLDTDIKKIPAHLQQDPKAIVKFNKAIIDATKDLCVSYKINTAFYEAMGLAGWEAMEETVHYIPEGILRIADAKRGDIGNTSTQYARAFFEALPFDAITVAPYMGEDSVKPFLAYLNKWTIVLGLTSNSGAADFEMQSLEQGEKLYERVLKTVSEWGSADNLMFVIGATQGAAFSHIRNLLPDHFFLVPGVGAQGGSLQEISTRAMNDQCGLLVNASRAIIYASEQEDFAVEARKIAEQYQFEMAGYLQSILPTTS